MYSLGKLCYADFCVCECLVESGQVNTLLQHESVRGYRLAEIIWVLGHTETVLWMWRASASLEGVVGYGEIVVHNANWLITVPVCWLFSLTLLEQIISLFSTFMVLRRYA